MDCGGATSRADDWDRRVDAVETAHITSLDTPERIEYVSGNKIGGGGGGGGGKVECVRVCVEGGEIKENARAEEGGGKERFLIRLQAGLTF